MTQTKYFFQDSFKELIFSYRSNKYLVTLRTEIEKFGSNSNMSGNVELQVF